MYGRVRVRSGAYLSLSRASSRLTKRLNSLAPPSRPGLRKSNSDHKSLRRFSTGVPVRAMRASALNALTCLVCRVFGFLMAWASSRMTKRHCLSASHLWRSAMP